MDLPGEEAAIGMDGVHELTRQVENRDQLDRASGLLADLDELLGLERDVLLLAGLSPEDTAAVVNELVILMELFERWPDVWSARELRTAVGKAGRSACLTASLRRPAPPSRLRKPAGVLAGAVVIVANGVAAPPGLRELSVFVGGQLITTFYTAG